MRNVNARPSGVTLLMSNPGLSAAKVATVSISVFCGNAFIRGG